MQLTESYYDQISVINTNLGAEEDDTVGPEESSFVEENVETEVRGDRYQAEDEGDQEEDTWTDQKVRVKELLPLLPVV